MGKNHCLTGSWSNTVLVFKEVFIGEKRGVDSASMGSLLIESCSLGVI